MYTRGPCFSELTIKVGLTTKRTSSLDVACSSHGIAGNCSPGVKQ